MNTRCALKGHALILIDLQNDFVEGGKLAVKDGRSVVAIANLLIPHFDLVIATQDWHPANHQSFVSQHPGMFVGQSFALEGLPQTAWPDHCVQGTFGAELVAELNRDGIHRIFFKGTDPSVDSYSGFFDNDHRHSTGLDEYLRQKQIDVIVLMGLATDYCVRFTALDAIQQGFKTILVLDGCRGVELQAGDVAKVVDELRQGGVEITDSRSVLDKIAHGQGM